MKKTIVLSMLIPILCCVVAVFSFSNESDSLLPKDNTNKEQPLFQSLQQEPTDEESQTSDFFNKLLESNSFVYIDSAAKDDAFENSYTVTEADDKTWKANENISLVHWYDVDYKSTDDGKYLCRGYSFNYILRVSGNTPGGTATFIILTNNMDIRFKDIEQTIASSADVTAAPEFILLGWY